MKNVESVPELTKKSNIQELEEEIRAKNSTTSLDSKCKTLPPRVSFHQPPTATPAAPSQSAVRPRRKARRAPPPPSAAHNLQIRSPSELLVGTPVTLEAHWLHKPLSLVIGTADYTASYLGSTVVKELLGTESTKKSIQKLRKSTSVVDCRITPEIILAISYRGVKFLNVPDHSLICEHEIHNIHCACQDSEDRTHFAYITKDRASKTHYCHVFCVQTMDRAAEVILTLGQAFEVAYQLALKESSVGGNGLARSHSTGSSATSRNLPSNSRGGLLVNHGDPLVNHGDLLVNHGDLLVNHSDLLVNQSDASATVAATASTNLSQYFAPRQDGHPPLLRLLADGKFHDVKRLLDIEGTGDVKMFRRLILSVGNGEFRNSHKVDKKVADDIFAHAINELTYRSENTTQLAKYYRSSYAEVFAASSKVGGAGAKESTQEILNGQTTSQTTDQKTSQTTNQTTNQKISQTTNQTTSQTTNQKTSQTTNQTTSQTTTQATSPATNPTTTSLSQYFTRDANSRIPLWVMMVEEQYEDIRGVFLAPPSLTEVQTLRLVAANMADKVFHETHRISKEVADEVFECAADELMAREGTMTQLLDHYNKSYN